MSPETLLTVSHLTLPVSQNAGPNVTFLRLLHVDDVLFVGFPTDIKDFEDVISWQFKVKRRDWAETFIGV